MDQGGAGDSWPGRITGQRWLHQKTQWEAQWEPNGGAMRGHGQWNIAGNQGMLIQGGPA